MIKMCGTKSVANRKLFSLSLSVRHFGHCPAYIAIATDGRLAPELQPANRKSNVCFLDCFRILRTYGKV